MVCLLVHFPPRDTPWGEIEEEVANAVPFWGRRLGPGRPQSQRSYESLLSAAPGRAVVLVSTSSAVPPAVLRHPSLPCASRWILKQSGEFVLAKRNPDAVQIL